MIPMCSSRRSPRPFTAGIPPILQREAQSAVSAPQLTGDGGWTRLLRACAGGGWDSALGDGGRSSQDGRALGLRVCPCPVGGSLAGPSEAVPAPANPSCCGIQQLSQPAHKFKVGSPRLPRGPSHETQVHTHAHTHIRMHTCNLYTHAHTGTLAVHSCTHMHTHLHTHPYICTRILPDRASRALGYNLGGGSPHTAPDLHMPGPKWLVRSHEAAAVPKPP